MEDFIHHGLECCWAVCEAKEHYQWLKESVVCAKCGIPFIAFFDAHIVVAPPDIHLGERKRGVN
ncbi:hypothetical protein BDZ94DRAFT_1273475 [Collybia nuda]|uniref:Uncharacterized protein n=1 Tax=Collybia nuda TaxID=64659 RepID=A0A9P5XV18_9AGAR|nr:hypothetical protein BDZ94DRAFT_1273475 [Collybia nuda]